MQQLSLNGQWIGHYRQGGKEHEIRADLVHENDRLHGTMNDRDTESERSIFEATLEAGLPPGSDELIVARLREKYPEAQQEPIRIVSQLPASSLLQGRVKNRVVTFTKTYQGEHVAGIRVGREFIGTRISAHQVQFRGELTADGLMLHGIWWIEAHQPGERRLQGQFELRR